MDTGDFKIVLDKLAEAIQQDAQHAHVEVEPKDEFEEDQEIAELREILLSCSDENEPVSYTTT